MSAHHRTTAWLKISRQAREYITPRLPLACVNCGRPVTTDQRWHVGHIIDSALGGPDTLENLGPSHSRCNTSAGGRLGQKIQQANRRRPTQDRNRPPW